MKKLMAKRITAIVLAALMIAALMPVTAFAHSGAKDVHDHTGDDDGIHVRIEAGANGDIDSDSNQNTPDQGEVWTFTAKPDAGYKFDHWDYAGNEVGGAFAASGAVLRITLSQRGTWIAAHWEGLRLILGHWDYAEYRAQAVFAALPNYSLSISTEGSGSVTKNPSKTEYCEGTDVILTANAEPGWQFAGWSGSITGTANPVTVRIDGNKVIKATFTPLPTYTLDVAVLPAGSGSVSKNPDASTYWQGSSVTLTANAASGYRFGGWLGSASGTANPLTLVMDSSKSVTATFVKQYYVTLNANGGYFHNESGVEGWRDENSSIDLANAHPDSYIGNKFIGWRDDLTGKMVTDYKSYNYSFSVTGNRSFTAMFGDIEYLDTTVNDSNMGYLGNDLDGHYGRGASVNLNDANPTARTGYAFSHWEEYNGGWEPVAQPVVTVGDWNWFRAVFVTANYTITYNLGSGTVSPANPASYTYFTNSFTLNNPTKTGYTFRGWAGTGIPEGTYSTNVVISKYSSGNRTYTANWTPVSYSIVYTLNGGTADPANRTSYTIEDSFTLTNPTKAGYDFIGWTGTGLSEKTMTVRISSGSTGAREYTANWRVAGITVTGYNGDYNAAAHSISVAGSLPTDTVTYSLDGNNYSASKPEFTDVTVSEGVKVYVRIERQGAAAYEGSAIVKITKAALTITAKDAFIKYGDPKPAFDVNISGYYGDVSALKALINYSCDYEAGDGAAEYTIIPDGFTSGNYDIHYEEGTLTVEKADAVIAVNGVNVTYDALPHGASGSAAGVDGTDLSSLLNLGETYTNAPGGTAHWSFAGNENYNAASGTAAIVINKAVLTVSADDITIEYGDAVPSYTYKIGIYTPDFWDGIVSGTPVINSSYVQGDNADSYAITVDVSPMTSVNYSFTAADGTLQVNKKMLHIYGENSAITYGDALPGFAVSYSPFVNGDDQNDLTGSLSFNCTYTAGQPADQYLFMPQGLDSVNYSISYHAGVLTVNKAPLKVTADNKSVIFLDAAPIYTASYSGFVAGDDTADLGGTLLLNCGYAAGNAVGTYTITPSGYTSDNYEISFVPGTLTVNTLYLNVRFVDYNGNTLGTDTVAYGTAADAPVDPVRAGHRFTGWDKPFDNVTSDITVTALYAINRYTVTFNDFNGTLIDTQSVNWRNGAIAPTEPVREGYTFTGWDTGFDPVTKNLIVTATYRINTYTVTFADFDGTVIDTQTVNWNTAADAPAEPSREGYIFKGWDVPFAAITADTTVTAQYSQIVTTDNEQVPGTVTGGDEEIPLAGGAAFAWWWILIGVGAAALLLFLILFVWKRRRPEEEQQ